MRDPFRLIKESLLCDLLLFYKASYSIWVKLGHLQSTSLKMFPFSRDHLKLSVWAQIFKIKWVLPEGELASIIKKLIGTPVFKVFHLSNSWVQLIIKI